MPTDLASPRLLAIVPAHNEADTIASVVGDIHEHLPDAHVLVVDDASTDGTAEKVPGTATVVSLPFNLGIGGAMQTGYRYAATHGYDLAVQIDGDGQHPASQVAQLLNVMHQKQADLVIGSRFLEREGYLPPPSRMLGIRILRHIINLATHLSITDPTSGLRLVNRRVIHAFAYWYPDDYPEPEVILLLHRAGLRVAEAPVTMEDRLAGVTSIPFVHGMFYVVKVTAALLLDLARHPWPRERINPS